MKDLRDTVELQGARQEVRNTISGGTPSWDAVIRAIRNWRIQLKIWEDQDQLKEAFAQGRLTIRTISHGSYKGTDEKLKLESIINAGAYNYESAHTAGRAQPDGVWTGADGAKSVVPIDASAAGIKKRMESSNFLRTNVNGRSNKNSLGLHALSCSLLNPDFPMTLKYYSGNTIVALMPLPLPKDVQLFYELRRMSKAGGCSQQFISEVVILASEFTRPQLAANLDMGTVFAPVSPQPHVGQPSFRYVKGDGTSKDAPEVCRTNAVNDYRTIIVNGSVITKGDKHVGKANAANEITVAYRKWGTQDKFPVFCICRAGKDALEEVTLGLMPAPPPKKPPYRPSSTPPKPVPVPTGLTYTATGTTYSKRDLKIVLV